ncbi:MAG: carboxypeptidase regulatory-like domain-containing protein [Myxococcales bacterium]|nr:carboxypeptidase regulatory-like domain-containing protein [Myxococcales bacterium]
MGAPIDAQPNDAEVPADAAPADAPPNPAPPADAAVQAVAPVGDAKLRGRVLVSGKRTPLGGIVVILQSAVREARTTTTDRAGRYVFDKVVADEYELKVDPDSNGGFGMAQAVMVTLKARQAKTQDVLVVPVAVPVRTPIPMPYGAPPARRRVV